MPDPVRLNLLWPCTEAEQELERCPGKPTTKEHGQGVDCFSKSQMESPGQAETGQGRRHAGNGGAAAAVDLGRLRGSVDLEANHRLGHRPASREEEEEGVRGEEMNVHGGWESYF